MRASLIRAVAVVLCLVAGPGQAAEPALPPLTGRVVDQAGILSPAAEAELSGTLEAHERATGQQVVVATLAALDGRAIEEVGVALGRAWGIGQKDKNTGAILLVAPNDRQVRIEVGYGLEGQLTDALARVIIERDILPRFRAGDMEAGVIAGAASMLATLRGDEAAAPPIPPALTRDPGESPIALVIVLFVLFMLLRGRRRRSRWPLVIGGLGGPPVIWHGGSKRRGRGGFGGFGGGFKGGGGSFGGGGASGRW